MSEQECMNYYLKILQTDDHELLYHYFIHNLTYINQIMFRNISIGFYE